MRLRPARPAHCPVQLMSEMDKKDAGGDGPVMIFAGYRKEMANFIKVNFNFNFNNLAGVRVEGRKWVQGCSESAARGL